MTTKKAAPPQHQPGGHIPKPKHIGQPEGHAATPARPPTNHGHAPAKGGAHGTARAANAPQHQDHPRAPRTPSAQRPHQRRRRQALRQRLTHPSAGAWFGILTGVLVIGIIAFAIINSHNSAPPAASAPQGMLPVGATAPAINALPATDGNSYSLAQYKGHKVVVLEFFAPWCPHCQDETAMLNQLQQEYGSKGVQVLSVSASPYGRNYESGDTSPISMSDMQWFSSHFGLNYPALFDPSLKAGTAYGVQAFPTLYVVNKQGVITYAGNGEMSYASLQQQVNTALGQ